MAVRRTLNRERVLAAGVRLADADGLSAVTMRRVAGELGVEAMSLYHHLPGKDGLLDGLVASVLDEIAAELAGSDEQPDWRAEVRRRVLAARTVMLRHPWAPALIGARETIPPGAYAHYEAVLATMLRGGLSYRLAHRGLHALGSMALGFVQELFGAGQASADDGDPTEEELADMATAYPAMAAMVAAELHDVADPTLGWCDTQTEFEFTLDLILDGLDRMRP